MWHAPMIAEICFLVLRPEEGNERNRGEKAILEWRITQVSHGRTVLIALEDSAKARRSDFRVALVTAILIRVGIDVSPILPHHFDLIGNRGSFNRSYQRILIASGPVRLHRKYLS